MALEARLRKPLACKLFWVATGFTLAELLIALAILGVIATFTIPKILNSSQNGQNTAIAKEAASMISGAYSSYTLSLGAGTGVTAGALSQYMNYVALDTASTVGNSSGVVCGSSTAVCLKLHNGGVLQYDTALSFGTTTGAIPFSVDPDGSGSQDAMTFWQYYNGRLGTGGQSPGVPAGSVAMYVTTTDPSYLSNWN